MGKEITIPKQLIENLKDITATILKVTSTVTASTQKNGEKSKVAVKGRDFIGSLVDSLHDELNDHSQLLLNNSHEILSFILLAMINVSSKKVVSNTKILPLIAGLVNFVAHSPLIQDKQALVDALQYAINLNQEPAAALIQHGIQLSERITTSTNPNKAANSEAVIGKTKAGRGKASVFLLPNPSTNKPGPTQNTL